MILVAHRFVPGQQLHLGELTSDTPERVTGPSTRTWRGPVGTFSGGSIATGYAKNYVYDPRLVYLSPPYYLNPGTSQWGFASFTVAAGSCEARPTAPPAPVPVVGLDLDRRSDPARTGNLGGRGATRGRPAPPSALSLRRRGGRARTRTTGPGPLAPDRRRGLLRRPFPGTTHPARRPDGRVAGPAGRHRRAGRRALHAAGSRCSAGIDKARFRRQVVPGEVLDLEVTLGRLSARAGTGHGRATVDGELACEVDLLFVIVDHELNPGARNDVRIATWNVNSLNARLAAGRGMDRLRPTRRAVHAGDEAGRRRFPGHGLLGARLRVGLPRRRAVERGGHRSAGSASRTSSAVSGTAADEQGCRLVAATCGGVRVHSVYVPNGREVGSEHYEAKLAWLGELRAYLDRNCQADGPRGGLRRLQRRPRRPRRLRPGRLGGLDPRHRARTARLCGTLEDWGLVDAFRLLLRPGPASSPGGTTGPATSTSIMGMRIDLVLLSRPLWPTRAPTRSSTATPGRASSPRTTPRSSSTSTP